jgi:hypothetical protein
MPITDYRLMVDKRAGGYVGSFDALTCACLHAYCNSSLSICNAVFALSLLLFAEVATAKAATPVRFLTVSTLSQCGVAQSRPHCAAESNNFKVTTFIHGPLATDVVHHCEWVCDELRKKLFGNSESRYWQPKCQVVLHGTRQAYCNAAGGRECNCLAGQQYRRQRCLTSLQSRSLLSEHRLRHIGAKLAHMCECGTSLPGCVN